MKTAAVAFVTLFLIATAADACSRVPKCGSKLLKKILDPYSYALRCGP